MHTTRSDYHHWQARLATCLLMLGLAVISLIILLLHKQSFWVFNCLMGIIDAILVVGLHWYCTREDVQYSHSSSWQQLLQWLGLFVLLYLTKLLVDKTLLSHFHAGIFVLLLLVLLIYISGIYMDILLVLVGITLAIIACCVILFKNYLFLIVIPIVIIIGLLIFWFFLYKKKKT